MYSGVPSPRTTRRCPRISISARVSATGLPPLRSRSSEPLDPGKLLEDPLDLAEELAAVVEKATVLGLQSETALVSLSEALHVARHGAKGTLQRRLLLRQAGIRLAQLLDQLDGAVDVLLEHGEPGADVFGHGPLPPSAPRTSASSVVRSRSMIWACIWLTSESVRVRSSA